MQTKNIVVLMDYAGEMGSDCLKTFLENDIKISAIVCVGDKYSEKKLRILKERTGGFYKKVSFETIIEKLDHLPVFITPDINSEHCREILTKLAPDIVVVDTADIIRTDIYNIPTIGMLNCHLAILPYMRGCSCTEWAILEDNPIGATCHFLIKQVDAGKIIKRFLLEIEQRDTYEQIRAKAIYLQAHTMVKGLEEVLSNKIVNDQPYKKEGEWYSPMRDKKLINKVKEKIKLNKYLPNNEINDGLPLEKISIDIR